MKTRVEEVESSLTAVEAFCRLRGRPHVFFLDSGLDPHRLGRWSFVGSDPFLVLKSRGRQVTITEEGHSRSLDADPFDVLRTLLAENRIERPPGAPPLVAGAVGYLAYDLCHFVERLPKTAADDLRLPEAYLAFYDGLLAFDHLQGRAYACASGLPQRDPHARAEKAQQRLSALRSALGHGAETPHKGRRAWPALPGGGSDELNGNFTQPQYLEAVETAREYICAGDIFQVNLSQRFDTSLSLPADELYLRLRQINPAPFAAYLGFDEVQVVSSSPERFLRRRGDLVETRPIKGTRPRGRSPQEDAALAQELQRSAKDRAEHVMIVDLERNDLGRVSCFGTVRVSELAALETYATVFHLTSTIEGRLRPDVDTVDLLRATFPGGSITGAPKVRSMEIIDELEPTRRSVYTGCIGYLGFDGDLDLNIAIRTILATAGRAYLQVGGAIVYDSDPQAEYDETLDKARALVQALRG